MVFVEPGRLRTDAARVLRSVSQCRDFIMLSTMMDGDATVAIVDVKFSAVVIQFQVGNDTAVSATRNGMSGVLTTAFVCAIVGVAVITYSIY